MHPLQEKFQITVPAKDEDGEPWVMPTYKVRGMVDGKFNVMPSLNSQGTDGMPMVLSGSSDVSGAQVRPENLLRGFEKVEMKGCDDQYTGEHVDHFYGDAGGFVERNNYLDRE